ncbi:YjgN family protein [Limnohabitans sp.]|uniref:YjgN family protein n=1 Tax=Limnohabitans sp. TaxID=1907725 RepID=UPI0037BE7056
MGLRFTGSGSEYFRIWIVNLLLTLLTLSLYWPFARARRMVYFHKNTLVGSDALGFHADPWKMFRGYLLVLVLGGTYSAVSTFVPELAWLPLLVLAVLWPVLWRSSLMFRLRNTSWRGVRFEFEGSLRGAYGVMLPLFIPILVLVAAGALAEAPEVAQATWLKSLLVLAVITALVFFLVFPWLMARMHAFQHSGYVFTAQRTALAQGKITGPLYLIGLKLTGMVLALSLVAGGIAALLGFGAGPLVVFGVFGLIYLAFPLVLLPYFKTRVQNLLWGNTRSEQLIIHSKLRFRDMFMVNLENWLLIVLTLGLYWPFAAVRSARVRLEAMAIEVHGDVNSWVANAPQQQAGVLGDAAGDFFGVDMGL